MEARASQLAQELHYPMNSSIKQLTDFTIKGKHLTVLFLVILFTAQLVSPEIETPNIKSDYEDTSVPLHSSFNKTKPCQETYSSFYAMFLAKCKPKPLVTIGVRTELYNTDEATTIDYLSLGLTQLSFIYFTFSLVYLVFLGFWISISLKTQPPFQKMHSLMAGMLVIKALTLIFAAEEKHHENLTGTHESNTLFTSFQIIRFSRLIIITLLISNGWRLLKPILQTSDKLVIKTMIPFQILSDVASIVLGETGHWKYRSEMLPMVDCVCTVALLAPFIVFVATLFMEMEKYGRNWEKLFYFRSFYMIVNLYILLTVSVRMIRKYMHAELNAVEGYRYMIVSNTGLEVNSFFFYAVLFTWFEQYFLLEDKED